METRTPQNPTVKAIAAIVGVLAIGLFVAWQDVTATDIAAAAASPSAEALPAIGYFPGQFTIRPAADESAEPMPTF